MYKHYYSAQREKDRSQTPPVCRKGGRTAHSAFDSGVGGLASREGGIRVA